MKFIDEMVMSLSSGKGGPGCVSFRREAHIPRGGPDGGEGGRGGHIIFKANAQLNSLVHFKNVRKFHAQNGQPGGGDNCSGKNGEDIVLELPLGTIIREVEGGILYDLSTDGEEIQFLTGGIGGKGNSFYKTSVNQAPGVAQKGMPGEQKEVALELKLIADIGIIGFPNVGKSTLISHISAARPKIADYHFTTLTPNLGVVDVSDNESFVVADIPGLVKGAHQGIGLGTQFLRHIERTKAFLHLIDVSGMSGRDPFEDFKDINYELEQYDLLNETISPLSKRLQMVALNKVDSAQPDVVAQVKYKFRKLGIEVFEISAVTGLNLKELKFALNKVVRESKIKAEPSSAYENIEALGESI